MKRKLFYYFKQWMIFIFLTLLAILLYLKNFSLFLAFVKQRQYNIIVISFTILVFSYIFDLISSEVNGNGRITIANKDALLIFGKTLTIVIVTSFVEQFLFYSTRTGRVVYIELWLMLSILFILERKSATKKRRSKNLKLLWLSTVPPDEIASKYDMSDILGNIIKTNDGHHEPSFLIYDYPLKNKSLSQTILKKVVEGTKAEDLITFIEEHSERIPLDYVDEIWLLHNIKAVNDMYNKAKNVIDFSLSILLLLLLFPIGFLFALAHWVESRGPLFYCQERLGLKSRPFKLIKFRTMVPDAEKNGPQVTEENDPRITKIGRIMRKCRLDEIPQFINVLKGEMSLIGPRPEREFFIRKLEKKIPFYRLRLEIKPGITGWAQVSYRYAGYNLEDHKRKLEYDLFYIKNRNLILDMIIILKTAKIMLKAIGS